MAGSPDVASLWPSALGEGDTRRAQCEPLRRVGRIRHVSVSGGLELVGASERALWLAGPDAVAVIDLEALALRHRGQGVAARWNAWTGDGANAAVIGDDLVVHADGELVRRAPDGSITARAACAGPLAAIVPCGGQALLGGATPRLVDVSRASFGREIWSAQAHDVGAPRLYDRAGAYRRGEAIAHPTLGLGVVQRGLGEARMLVAFDVGGRSIEGRARAGEGPARALGGPRRPRAYGNWLVGGGRAWLGYRDGRSGELKVKGAEAIELRELATGAELVVPGVATIECAAASRHEHERVITGHFLHAADARGVLLSPYASDAGALHELDADGELRWSVDALAEGLLDAVALAPDKVVTLGRVSAEACAVTALDRADGRTLWHRRLPTGEAEPALALADGAVYVAWARHELSLAALEPATGRPLVQRERLGHTFAARPSAVAVVPRPRGVLLVAASPVARGWSTLVTAVDE